MTAITQKRRLRVERRAIPAVVEAVNTGKLSVNIADRWLHLSKRRQAEELARKLEEAREREKRHQRVAAAIQTYLGSRNGQRVDLVELSEAIREALAFAKGEATQEI